MCLVRTRRIRSLLAAAGPHSYLSFQLFTRSLCINIPVAVPFVDMDAEQHSGPASRNILEPAHVLDLLQGSNVAFAKKNARMFFSVRNILAFDRRL